MGKGGKGGENSKKAAGNARKQEAASSKKQKELEKLEAEEAEEWSKGAKTKPSKKQLEEEKKAEAAKKKKEREEMLKQEEESLPSKPSKNAKRGAEKIAAKRTAKLDDSLSMFSSGPDTEISASGIDNALDALSLATSNNKPKIDRHPERRFKAAFTAYKDANIDRIKKENPGLNFTQREKILYEEFKKHPDNPFNQESIAYNASVNDIAEKKKEIKQNLSNKYESGI